MIKTRRLLAVFLVAIILFPLGASVTRGTAGLLTASTEHFDIIYRSSNMETAALLYNNCEDIYASLVEFYSFDPNLHIPVVVTGEYKSLNAYYTSSPANHIVMFDTVSDIGQLSNYPQTILYIFRHELTHAFQFNIRGPFMQFMANVFGDFLSLSPILYMYPSLSEGGAVLTESMDGYGRLNDSYAMQIVRQAKIEGLFPSWLEVSGARDTYPSGLLYYNFAAAFLEYLSLTYGYDKVASLYVDFSKLSWSTFRKIKKVFGIPVKQAWQDFYDWVEVPTTVQDSEVVESRTQSGSYASPVLAPDGSLFVYDYSCWDVLRFSDELSVCKPVLSVYTDEQNISLSSDGTRILVSDITKSSSSVRLYELRGGKASFVHKFVSSDVKNFRKGGFVSYEGRDSILLWSNAGQNTYLDLYDPDTYEPVEGKGVELGFDVIATDIVDIGDGRVAFLYSHASCQNIAILDLSDMSVRLVSNPDNIEILSLTKGKDGESEVLCFSWCPDDSKSTNLCRYGELRLSDDGAEMVLSCSDISGGVNAPIRINDDVVFVARYFEQIKLRTVAVADLNMHETSSLGFEGLKDAPKPDTLSLSEASKRYRAIKYFKDGILFPFGMVQFGASESIGLGLTWLTTDPTETFTHQIAAGYQVTSVMGSYTFTYSGSIPFSVYLSAIYGTGVFADPTTLQAGDLIVDAGISSSLGFELDSFNSLGVSGKFEFAAFSSPSSGLTYGIASYISASHTFARRTGMNPYAVFGFSTTAYLSDLRPGARFVLRLPQLMWWRCDGPNVTNLPLSISVDALYDKTNSVVGLNGTATVILYSREIQRAIPVVLFGLHFQRFTLDLNYNASYITGTDVIGHTLSLTAAFSLTPVLGEYLTNLKMKLGATLETDFEEVKVRFAFGTST